MRIPATRWGRSAELDSLAAECDGECLTVVADVRDDAAVAAAVEAAMARFGRIDVLFNNAGICAYGLAHELTEDEWDTMLDINLKGAWLVARRVIPHMIAAQRGVIVNNSSIAGLRGMGRLWHYAASKWGLTGLTKSWAIELAPHGIRVVSIHPTGVNTPLNDGLAELEGMTPLEIAERSAGNLLPVPWIEPEDVAEAVALPGQRPRAVHDRHDVRDRRRPAEPLTPALRRALRRLGDLRRREPIRLCRQLAPDQAVDVRAEVGELRLLLRGDLIARERDPDRQDLAHGRRRVREHDDPVGEVDGLVDVVRDEEDRDPVLLAHAEHEVLEVASCLCVDRCERLVHQQDQRLVCECAGDRDALLHPAGQLPRVVVDEAGEPDRLERLLDERRPLAPASAACAEAA